MDPISLANPQRGSMLEPILFAGTTNNVATKTTTNFVSWPQKFNNYFLNKCEKLFEIIIVCIHVNDVYNCVITINMFIFRKCRLLSNKLRGII